jgi:hypothetical protein
VVESDVPLKAVRDLLLEGQVIVLLTAVVAVVLWKAAQNLLKVVQTIALNMVGVKSASILDAKR